MIMDEKLKSILDKVIRLTLQNDEFGTELRKALQIKPSASRVNNSNDARLKHIESYLGLDYYVDGQPSLIDYSYVPEAEIRAQLISDNREMMRFRYGTRYHAISFVEYCRYAHLQVEMLLNYFYDRLESGDLEAVKMHINRYNKYAQITDAKSLSAISYNYKLWSFCDEFSIDIKYRICLDNIREVRNQSSHRSPGGEERTMEESRKKLINMGIPLHPKGGYVQTTKLKEGTSAFNLYNSMVKNTDWYKEYKVLVWMAQKEQYDNIMESIKLVSSTIKQSLIS